MAHACNPSTLEAKAGGSPEVGSSRQTWPTWWNPVFKKKEKKYKNRKKKRDHLKPFKGLRDHEIQWHVNLPATLLRERSNWQNKTYNPNMSTNFRMDEQNMASPQNRILLSHRKKKEMARCSGSRLWFQHFGRPWWADHLRWTLSWVRHCIPAWVTRTKLQRKKKEKEREGDRVRGREGGKGGKKRKKRKEGKEKGKEMKSWPGMVAHACNTTALEGWGRWITWGQEFKTNLDQHGETPTQLKIQKLSGCGGACL